MADADVQWDQAALDVFFDACADEILPRLTQEVEDYARAIAPVRQHRTASYIRRRSRGPGSGGSLKESVQSDTGRDYVGPYGDIAALWYGRFLDPKARQLYRLYPFLPTALFTVCDGRNMYL